VPSKGAHVLEKLVGIYLRQTRWYLEYGVGRSVATNTVLPKRIVKDFEGLAQPGGLSRPVLITPDGARRQVDPWPLPPAAS
jgi:hypothetical protein